MLLSKALFLCYITLARVDRWLVVLVLNFPYLGSNLALTILLDNIIKIKFNIIGKSL